MPSAGAGLEVLPFDLGAGHRYGRLAATLLGEGIATGIEDTMVAAHALARGSTLVTHDRRHFERLKGRRVEDWF